MTPGPLHQRPRETDRHLRGYSEIQGTRPQTLGYGLAGYTAGLVNVVAVDPHWWLSMAFVAIGGGVGELTEPVVDMFVSDGGWQGQRLGSILSVVAATCAVLSVPFIPLGRWCLSIRMKPWKVRAEQ